MHIKQTIRSLPVVGALSRMVYPPRPKPAFNHSSDYWERRYRGGGNSGSGSYNRLAVFKAAVINDFVATHDIASVIEFGCGDGAQLELAKYSRYIGVDVSQTIIDRCRRKFGDQPNYTFLHTSEVTPATRADLSLSLDVIYHLVEDEIFGAYMDSVFDAARHAVIIYSSNDDRPSTSPHVRHRKFTNWAVMNRPDFALIYKIANAYPFDEDDPENTSFADFYIFWR